MAPNMGSGAGSSSGGPRNSTGGPSTSMGGVWFERRRTRIQSNKDLIRAIRYIDDEEDVRDVQRDFDWIEGLER